MKKLILLLLLTSTLVHAQIVNIPDSNFKAELIADGVDVNADGEIQLSEAVATTTMALSTSSISDLEGLQSFINLETFWCGDIGITTLDLTSNVDLTSVESNSISLASIDVTTCQLLEDLRIYNSAITTLDCNSNISLTYLSFIGNDELETVFIKNGSDESTNIDPGSWSENWAFQNNAALLYVCADEFQAIEIQQFAGTDYPVNTFCTFSPGGNVNTITGVTQFDDENDGCDSGDTAASYTSFNVGFNGIPTGVIAYSNNSGIYNVYAGEIGTYNLLPNPENPIYFNLSPSPADVVITVIDDSTIIQDFCMEADGIHPDLEVAIAPIIRARPGFEATYSLTYKNKGNQTLSGSVVFNYDDTVLDFVSASTTPDNQGVGTLSFNFTDLSPFQNEAVEIALDVNGPTDTPPVNIDDILVFDAVVNPIAGDETPADNTFVYDQVVVGSFDPNNILCIQGEEVSGSFIGEFLHYVVNFENTGSAPAENVVVTMDINPDDFDPSSLQILNASHDMDVTIINNHAEFVFEMINLDTGGHGNILLKIKTKSDLTLNDNVSAQASIYFDFNFPIDTNEAITAFTVLGVNEFDETDQIVVFPNPASDVVKLQSPVAIKKIIVFDIQGREVEVVTPSGQVTEVNISTLTSGIYFFSIETEYGVIVKKISKR